MCRYSMTAADRPAESNGRPSFTGFDSKGRRNVHPDVFDHGAEKVSPHDVGGGGAHSHAGRPGSLATLEGFFRTQATGKFGSGQASPGVAALL